MLELSVVDVFLCSNNLFLIFSALSSRHPEASKRPQFAYLLQTLSRSEYELLHMPAKEGDRGRGQASVLGAPLDVSKNTFTDLQNTYTDL